MSAVGPAPARIDALPAPDGWPLLGHFPQIDFNEFHRQLERWADIHGDAYRIRLGPTDFVVLSTLEASATLLRERPERFSRRRQLETIFEELGFNGLFSADGEDWKRQRRIVITALNSARLHQFYDSMHETTLRLLARWSRAADAGATVDLCADLMRYTVDITTQLAFGIDFNTVETDGPVIQHHLDKVFPMLNRRLGAPFAYWRYFRLAKDRELDAAVAAIHAQIAGIIAQCRARIAANPTLMEAPTNFLEAMIAAKETEQLPFSNVDIIANVFTLLLAGEDTTANTLAWAIKFFLDHPVLMTRVRAEVDGVLGNDAVPVTHDTASSLDLVEAFANETMRLKPVAPILVFEAKEDVILADIAIPAGASIVLLARRIATREAHFSEATRFDLDRWLERAPDSARMHNQKAFIPFGGGPRFCPGRNLALLEIKVVLAMLLKNFEVELANDGQAIDERFAFTMSPTNLLVRFRRREHVPR